MLALAGGGFFVYRRYYQNNRASTAGFTDMDKDSMPSSTQASNSFPMASIGYSGKSHQRSSSYAMPQQSLANSTMHPQADAIPPLPPGWTQHIGEQVRICHIVICTAKCVLIRIYYTLMFRVVPISSMLPPIRAHGLRLCLSKIWLTRLCLSKVWLTRLCLSKVWLTRLCISKVWLTRLCLTKVC